MKTNTKDKIKNLEYDSTILQILKNEIIKKNLGYVNIIEFMKSGILEIGNNEYKPDQSIFLERVFLNIGLNYIEILKIPENI